MSRGADVLGVGLLRPEPSPVAGDPPPAVGGPPWSAYRLEASPGKELFSRARLRRLGRAQAMALSVVKLGLEACNVPALTDGPVGVCMGTAWAEFGVELAFLENMIRRGEKGARPTKFANSVHNALASQVAMSFKFTGENHTFTHDTLSFESALWQGIRLVNQGRVQNAVVCGVDALTEFLQLRGHLLGMYRTEPAPLSPLEEEGSPRGTLPGEGAAAFILSPPGQQDVAPLARIQAVSCRGGSSDGLDAAEQAAFVLRTLDEIGLPLSDSSLLLLGANGDGPLDEIYQGVADRLDPPGVIGVYRHLTGDYATASALGLASAVQTVAEGQIPAEIRCSGETEPGAPEMVVIYHVSNQGHHSAMVVTRA